nr:hypothetical protein StreXyl84_45610 [Streptomyces sp. Xyl84]
MSWTVAAGACRDRVTSGSEGRYMSIASGGVAVRLPRISVTSSPVRRAARSGAGDGGGGVASGLGFGTAVSPAAVLCGADAPPSDMCPSLSGWSATYALSSYTVPRNA